MEDRERLFGTNKQERQQGMVRNNRKHAYLFRGYEVPNSLHRADGRVKDLRAQRSKPTQDVPEWLRMRFGEYRLVRIIHHHSCIGGSMTKEENLLLADKLRQKIYELRKKGYMFKIYCSVVNYSSTRFYNFMTKGYKMSDGNLLLLKS